jgi:hypothetical protein
VTRPATVRFYIDADVLGLAKVLAELRSDVTYPGDPGGTVHKRTRGPCPITTPATDDDIWIPEVTSRDWLIITRDRRIQDHRAEVDAVRTAGARMVTLASKDAIGTWSQLEVFMSQWRQIGALLELPGPFIYRASRSGLSAVDLSALP